MTSWSHISGQPWKSKSPYYLLLTVLFPGEHHQQRWMATLQLLYIIIVMMTTWWLIRLFVNFCELLTDTIRRHRLPCKPRELIVVARELFMTQRSLIQHVVIEKNYWNYALCQRRGKSHAAIGTLPVAIRNDSSGSRLIYSWSDLPSIVYLIMITPISLSRVLKAGYN